MHFYTAVADYPFLQRALVTAIVVGALCGAIGALTILRGLALMGDAVSHAVLPGVAASFALGVGFLPGALAAGLLSALGIGYIQQHSRIKPDAAIGIVFTAMFALGIVLMTLYPADMDLTTILFGNVLAVRPAEMWATIGLAAAVLAVLAALFKELQVSIFDPVMAAAYGLPVARIHRVLMLLLTVVTVIALQTVGVVLVVAMLITPAATAHLLTDRLGRMVLLASAVGAAEAVVGLYLSFRFDLPSGAVIVLVGAAVFAVVLVVAPRHGLLARRLPARRPAARGSA